MIFTFNLCKFCSFFLVIDSFKLLKILVLDMNPNKVGTGWTAVLKRERVVVGLGSKMKNGKKW